MFEGSDCMLEMQGKKYHFGHRYGKLWRLNSAFASCFYGQRDDSLELWHLRLGHLNIEDVKRLSCDQMIFPSMFSVTL